MAFGFLKKLVAKLTGRKAPAPKAGGKGAQRPQGSQGNGRGRRGHRGRFGEGREGVAPGSGARSAEPRREGRDGFSPRGERGRDGRRTERRGERGREGRRREGMRSAPRSVNTAPNEMRPGGVVSEAEMQARRAAHAAWDPASFVVPPLDGKKRFQDFNLPSEVLHGIADLGFQYCTDIQALSLEHALAGKNVAGKAQTGSGKTAAFLVAILTRYLRTPESRAKMGGCPRALVIAPTRELVIQICKDADAIGKYCGLRSLAVYGGMDLERQAQEILDAPVDLLVATPGRLLDFCKRRAGSIFRPGAPLPQGVSANNFVIDLRNVDTLVIDEADRMLDMGFIPDVKEIVRRLPPKEKRATMLYSATLTDDVMRLASQWMETPVKAEVESEHNAADTVREVIYIIRADEKLRVLFNHIALHPDARAIVFCNRKSTTETVYDALRRRGVSCEMLSGDVNQNRRLRVLDDIRAGSVKIVVATDVAGRGIDIKGLEYVINYDFPYEAEDYVHRIGRTGRAGDTGIAISFADEDESFAIPEIEAYIKRSLKCTMIAPDDPLLKPLAQLRAGEKTQLTPVDEEARAVVDAREAVTEEQKAAAAAMVGGIAVRNAAGQAGTVAVKDDVSPRKLPSFENVLEPKKVVDETDAYSKPVEQKTRFEEWSVEAPVPAAEPAPTGEPVSAPAAVSGAESVPEPASEPVPAPAAVP